MNTVGVFKDFLTLFNIYLEQDTILLTWMVISEVHFFQPAQGVTINYHNILCYFRNILLEYGVLFNQNILPFEINAGKYKLHFACNIKPI